MGDRETDISIFRHPRPPDWLRAKVNREVKDVHRVILHAARILPLWARPSKEELAAARPAHVSRARRTVGNGPHLGGV